MKEHNFLKEVKSEIDHIDKFLIETFKREKIQISTKDIKAFSIFRTALLDCKATLITFEPTDDNEKWRTLYKNHEAWKKMALEDPLISDYLKDEIRNNTKIKRIHQSNGFSTEVARSLKGAMIYLTTNNIMKKEDSRHFLHRLVQRCFSESPGFQAMDEDTLRKALQRVYQTIKET